MGATNRAINELVTTEHERVVELVTELERQREQLAEQRREIGELKQQMVAYSGMRAYGDEHVGGEAGGYNAMRARPTTAGWTHDQKRGGGAYRPDSAASAPGAFPEGARWFSSRLNAAPVLTRTAQFTELSRLISLI
jgi:hypothetical protein